MNSELNSLPTLPTLPTKTDITSDLKVERNSHNDQKASKIEGSEAHNRTETGQGEQNNDKSTTDSENSIEAAQGSLKRSKENQLTSSQAIVDKYQKMAQGFRNVIRQKNNGWPNDEDWKKLESKWCDSLRLLLGKDEFTIEQFKEVTIALRDGTLDSAHFVWARNAVKSIPKLRKLDSDGMSYMKKILSQLGNRANDKSQGRKRLLTFTEKFGWELAALKLQYREKTISKDAWLDGEEALQKKYDRWLKTERGRR